MERRLKRIVTAIQVISLLIPGCAGPITPEEPIPGKTAAVATPPSGASSTPQLTPNLAEKTWDLGEIEYRCSINIRGSDGKIYPMDFYFPLGSGWPVTEQAPKVIDFFLRRKTEPIPQNITHFRIFFTKTEPPAQEDSYAITVPEKGEAAISLKKIKNKPLSSVSSIQIDYQAAVNVVAISEWCNLLWDPSFAKNFDLPPELQGIGQGHFCDSVGALFAAAMRGLTYQDYLEELQYWFFFGDPSGRLPLVSFSQDIFNEATAIVSGGSPIRASEIK